MESEFHSFIISISLTEHPVVVAGRDEEPAVDGERDDGDGGLVPRHEADAVAREAVPQSHAAVARPRGHVVVVGVEGEAVHVGEVAHEDAHALRLLSRPQPNCFGGFV